jgi:peptidoglycan/LPS O-acetylase OafA/YrhL
LQESLEKGNKLHFHTLDALRFFAFLKIFISHIPTHGNFPIFNFLKKGGGIGVSFFFVLSGFLITYLLTHEKKQNGKINIVKFFTRRSLRIWPLFFLWVILAYALPNDFLSKIGFHMVGGGYNPDWKFSFLFLENYKMLLEDNFPKTTPLPVFWSLCIEEQFYILWMICLSFIPYKHIPKFLIVSVFVSWLARYTEAQLFTSNNIVNNDAFTNLDLFAIGGLLGYAVTYNYSKLSSWVNKQNVGLKGLIIAGIIGVVLCHKFIFSYTPNSTWFILTPTVQAICFTILLLIFIPQNSILRIKDSSILSYLGKISYGLYVYHIICIHVVFQYYINNNIQIETTAQLLFFISIVFSASVILSMASYHFFEMPFLKLRNRHW